MKKLMIGLWLWLPVMLAAQVNLMTYNIRLGSVDDGPNHWNIRKDKLLALIDFYDCSIMGLQEVQLFQLQYLTEGLKNHVYLGKPRTNDVNAEYSCILYDTMVYQAQYPGTIWLSPTPDTISIGWDASLPRIASYALFKDKQTQLSFWVINTHLDHKGLTARHESAKILVELTKKIYQITPAPVFLMGDFNARPEENTIAEILTLYADTRAFSTTAAYGGPDTWNAFAFDKPADGRIDYIFLYDPKAKMRVYKHHTIMDHYDGKYPSDHFPVMIRTGFYVPPTRKGTIW